MKIDSISIEPYAMPVLRPLRIGNVPITIREGAILRLIDSEGRRGFGEIAPLPGLHTETLATDLAHFNSLKEKLTNQALPSDLSTINPFLDSIGINPACTLLRLALEMALFDLLDDSFAATNHLNVPSIRLNGLIMIDDPHYRSHAINLLKSGYSFLKVKIGNVSVEDAINSVGSLLDLADSKAIIRLDVNRKWTREDAIRFGRAIDISHIDYIEEPCTTEEDQHTFFDATSIKVALDETLLTHSVSCLKELVYVKAMILKPSMLGGLIATEKWISRAKEKNLIPVLSSTFETAIGLRAYVKLALRNNLVNIAHGLDTWRWLYTVAPAGFPAKLGQVEIGECWHDHT